MSSVPQEFAFTDGDRTFTCRVEASRMRDDAWWWFHVSTERHQRHAPFRAAASDTPAGVAARMVAYYDDLLARRAAPPVNRWQRRPVTGPVVGAPADVALVAPADAVATAPSPTAL